MRRLRFAFTILALLALGVTGAGASSLAAESAPPKMLRVQWAGEWIDDLEPQTNESGIMDLTMLNYEGLTRFDEELNVVPGAAESWQISPDGLTITFHLREHLTYSDGAPLTAERFRYAIARRCDPRLTSWGAESLFDIVGCKELNAASPADDATPANRSAHARAKANLGVTAVDDRTLEIRLRQPAPYFPTIAAGLGFIPIKQELIEAGGAQWWRDPANWVGNGPFQVSAFGRDAQPPRITLTANERYWSGRPRLDGIELVVIPSEQTTAAYQRGDLDIIYADFARIPEFEADPLLSRELVAIPLLATDVFNFNWTEEPFQDKHVREAFAYAFDREWYCKTIDYTCRPVLSWIPRSVPGAIQTDAYGFDPEKARAALAASTYGSAANLPEIVWYYPENDDWSRRQAEWIRAQFLEVLGVELTLRAAPGDHLDISYMREHPDAPRPQIMDTWWWVDTPDPHFWMQYWTCGDEIFAAFVGYCNPDYDALVARADRELDPIARTRLAEESQRLLIADAPAIFGYTFDNIFLVKPSVTGYAQSTPNQSFPGLATPLTVDIVQTGD